MARETYTLILFVTGETPASRRQVLELEGLLDQELGSHYQLSVVNVFRDPETAVRYDVSATPTLIKRLPEPVRRTLYRLRDRERVLSGLELEHARAD